MCCLPPQSFSSLSGSFAVKIQLNKLINNNMPDTQKTDEDAQKANQQADETQKKAADANEAAAQEHDEEAKKQREDK